MHGENPIAVRRYLALIAAAGLAIISAALLLRDGLRRASAVPSNALSQIMESAPLPATPLTSRSKPEDVIALMIHSHTLWRTLQAEVLVSWPDAQGAAQTFVETVTVEQYGKVHLEHGPVGGEPTFLWVTNGVDVWQVNLEDQTYTLQAVPASMRSLEAWSPPLLPADPDPSQVVIPHPLEVQIPSLLASKLFPLGTAQAIRDGRLSVLGEDNVAGRKVVLLRVENIREGELDSTELLWVDATTGVILKYEPYVGLPSSGQWFDRVEFLSVVYDEPIPGDPFTFHPAPHFREVSPPD